MTISEKPRKSSFATSRLRCSLQKVAGSLKFKPCLRRDRADFCGFQSQVDEIPIFQIDFFLVGRRHYGLEGERRRSGFSVRSATGIKGKKANLGAEFGSASCLVTTNDAHAENYPIKVRWK